VRALRQLAVVVAALALAGCGGSARKLAATPAPEHTPAPRTDPAAMAARADVPILCWHQIRAATARDSTSDRSYIVSPKTLAAQLAALDHAGYHPVTGQALVAHVALGKPLPRKPVLLTFDDASAGQYSRAFPVLRRHHFKATFFIMTVVLGKPGWLTRGQVRELDRAGMTIGAHTWDHKPVPQYTGSDWQTEITAPTRDLERLVGHRIRLFAYPYGLHESQAIEHLWSAGLRAAFQLGERLDRRHPLWTIRRIIVAEISGQQLLQEMRKDF
jgi:peptidoglycan/xylan/chitin deacetylase (PgdA/CDA1 family)